MDKLAPVIRDTPLTTKQPSAVSNWFTTEATAGIFTPAEFAWLQAQGWRPTAIVIERTRTWYALSRRVIRPEAVLQDLVTGYTEAYNEGRALNDQRYDDLVLLHTALLDKTEDAFNAQEAADGVYEGLVESIVAAIGTDFAGYSAEVTGSLDAWGDSLLAEVNARFDAELSKAQQGLIDRGLYNGTMWASVSAGVERERQRALTNAKDQITQRRLELRHKVNDERANMRTRVLAARDRLRVYLSNARDRQVAVRNATADALARLVERREDDYPDLADVGRIAAALGGGSPGQLAP